MLSHHDIIHNVGLGALILHAFVVEYHKEKKSGAELEYIMPVLPIVFNRSILNEIYNMNKKGGLNRALADNYDFPIGIQSKMEALSNKTFKSLNIAFACNLLTYDKITNTFVPERKTILSNIVTTENRKKVYGAIRLGYWFANTPTKQLFKYLNLKF